MNTINKTPFYNKVRKFLFDNDIRVKEFLKDVDLSGSEWHFIGRGMKPLREIHKKRILNFIERKKQEATL